MAAYNEYESGQEISEEEFKKRFPKDLPKKKPKAQPKANEEPTDAFSFGTEPELEPEQFEQESVPPKRKRLSAQDMAQAEEEITQRQMVEYKERPYRALESEVEVSSELIKIAAKMAVAKELMPAKDAAGIERNMAIEIEEDYPEMFTDDLVKGNFGLGEQACIFGHMTVVNTMKTLGQAKKFSFIPACRFNKMQMDTIINISRGMNGFSAVLMRTDKHVSEGVVEHVQRAFIEKKKKKWGFM